MGDRTGPIYVLAWQRTLGEMVHYKTLLAITCANPNCKAWTLLDVAGMARFRGANTSLWNCSPPCPKCGARGHYMASTGHSTPFRPLKSLPGRKVYGLEGTANDDVPPDDPEARRRAWLQSFGFTKRDVRRIRALAEECTERWTPPALVDLDVPIRIMAVHPSETHPPRGDELGVWNGNRLLYWRLNGREFETWERQSTAPGGWARG